MRDAWPGSFVFALVAGAVITALQSYTGGVSRRVKKCVAATDAPFKHVLLIVARGMAIRFQTTF
jgi:hypothetical protein